jgi:CheY-like chemotaxis protein
MKILERSPAPAASGFEQRATVPNLVPLGHDVPAAEDGRRLVGLYREFAPDLVVTDFAMPGLDGLAAAGEVNHERPVPVILLSGGQDAEGLSVAAGHVVRFLPKPVKYTELMPAVESVAAQAAPRPAACRPSPQACMSVRHPALQFPIPDGWSLLLRASVGNTELSLCRDVRRGGTSAEAPKGRTRGTRNRVSKRADNPRAPDPERIGPEPAEARFNDNVMGAVSPRAPGRPVTHPRI